MCFMGVILQGLSQQMRTAASSRHTEIMFKLNMVAIWMGASPTINYSSCSVGSWLARPARVTTSHKDVSTSDLLSASRTSSMGYDRNDGTRSASCALWG